MGTAGEPAMPITFQPKTFIKICLQLERQSWLLKSGIRTFRISSRAMYSKLHVLLGWCSTCAFSAGVLFND